VAPELPLAELQPTVGRLQRRDESRRGAGADRQIDAKRAQRRLHQLGLKVLTPQADEPATAGRAGGRVKRGTPIDQKGHEAVGG
jgi:hypothetical protein